MATSTYIEALRTSEIPPIETLRLKGDICLFETASKRYLLSPSIAALNHGDWEDDSDDSPMSSHLTLRCANPGDLNKASSTASHTLHLRSNVAVPSTEAVFVPLGWLVQEEKKFPGDLTRRRTTHYVVLRNLSTKPYSLWLVFDYESYDDEDEIGKNALTDEGIHNKITRYHEQQWYTIPHESDQPAPDTGKSIADKFLALYCNKTQGGRLISITSNKDTHGLQESGRRGQTGYTTPILENSDNEFGFVQDHVFPHNTSPSTSSIKTWSAGSTALGSEHEEPQSIAGSKPLESQDGERIGQLRPTSTKSTQTSVQPNACCCFHGRSPLTDKPTFTFLGLSEPFDLACICSNVKLWKDDCGIDSQHVMDCLSKANVCLGPTLRATYAEAGHKGVLDLSQFFKKA